MSHQGIQEMAFKTAQKLIQIKGSVDLLQSCRILARTSMDWTSGEIYPWISAF